MADALVTSRVCCNLTEFSVDSQASSELLLSSLGHDRPPRAPKVPLPFWRNIQFLCLSPDCFRSHYHTPVHDIGMAIRRAADVIRFTPTIRVMELWGSSPSGSAYLFRYKAGRDRHGPEVTWMSSSHLSVDFDGTFWAETFPPEAGSPGVKLRVTPFPESVQDI